MSSGHFGLLSWTIDPSPTCSTVSIQGELDMASVEPLRAALDAVTGGDGVVIFELSGLTFMDSTGLRLLLDVKRCTDEAGGAMFIRDASAPVERILEMTGTASLFVQRLPDARGTVADQTAAAAG